MQDIMQGHSLPTKCARHVEPGCPYRQDDIMMPEEAVSTGTTIMALKFDGGVIMCADSRTSTGDYIANRGSRKISSVHDRILVCRCGSAADTQALTSFVQNYLGQQAMELDNLGNRLPRVRTAANLFQLFAYNNKDMLLAGLLIGGYDDREGYQVYSIPLGGSLLKVPFAADGSGSSYITAYCDANFKENMSKDEALQFAKNAVSLAMSRDGSSGGMIRTAVITKDGIDHDIVNGNQLPFGDFSRKA